MDLSLVQLLIEILATLAFAPSGLLEVAHKKLDPVGAVVVASPVPSVRFGVVTGFSPGAGLLWH